MRPNTPYSSALGDQDPLAAMRTSAARVRTLIAPWSVADYERAYAPGKWTARQVLIHLAQTELALGSRARLALTTPDYTAQPFDQDQWIGHDAGLSGPQAADTLLALMAMNLAFFNALSVEERAVRFSHPEYGELTLDWLIHQMAGHHIHHLGQLETIR
jgi:hypothetical protein